LLEDLFVSLDPFTISIGGDELSLANRTEAKSKSSLPTKRMIAR